MYKSIKVEDVLGKSNFNKNYLDRTSLILSNREIPAEESIIANKDSEDMGWKEINRKIAASLQTLNKPDIEKKTNITDISKIHIDNVSDDLNELLNMFQSAGINVRVTSGYREGAIMKNGRPSKHASGEAVDIVPKDGNYEAIDIAIANSPEIQDFMIRNNIGIFPEITEEVMKQTGASGPHYHVVKGGGQKYLGSIKHHVKQSNV